MKHLFIVIMISVSAGLAGSAHSPATTQNSTARAPERIIVHMKHYTDDLHAAYMAMQLAERLQSRGADVTLLLDLDGARFADAEGAGIRDTRDRNFSERYGAFVQGGGRGLVCRHCAHLFQVAPDRLRKNMKLASMDEIAGAVISADKIIEY